MLTSHGDFITLVGKCPRRHPGERQARLKETAAGDLVPEPDEGISPLCFERVIDGGEFGRSISRSCHRSEYPNLG